MKSSQSNFNLRSPSSYLGRSYLITTVGTIAQVALQVQFEPSKVSWAISSSKNSLFKKKSIPGCFTSTV